MRNRICENELHEQDIGRSLEAIVAETVEIPTFPPVARKVIELVDKDSTSTAELEHLVSKDQDLATRVLRFVGSAYLGSGRRVETILHAIMLIGFDMLRALVVAASIRNMFRHYGPTERYLWEHSVFTSVAASGLARETRRVNIELAIAGGLLHDVGKVVMNNSDPERCAKITDIARTQGVSFADLELEEFGFTHSDVGALLLSMWDFPEILQAVVSHHSYYVSRFPSEETTAALCVVVAAANEFSHLWESNGMDPTDSTRQIFSEIGVAATRIDHVAGEISSVFTAQRDGMLI